MMAPMASLGEAGAAARVTLWSALAATLSVVWLPGVAGRFGPGHTGFNGAMWGLSVHAIDSAGLVGSKFGAVRGEAIYGSHPPLLSVVLWLTRLVLGRGEWPMRLSMIAAAVLALALLYRLCVALGATSTGAALGVVVAATTGVFLCYGAMIDTWVLGFPFGLVVLLTVADGRVTPWRLAGAVACGLCSWQGVVLVALVIPVAVARFGWRHRFVACLLAGVAGAVLYRSWVSSGGGRFDVGWPFDDDALAAFGPALVLAPLALWAKDRAVAAVMVAAPLVYGAAFSGKADVHAYWMFWLVGAIAVGMAVLSTLVRPGQALAAVVVLAGAGLLTASDIRDTEATRARDGLALADRIEAADLEQPWVPLVGQEFAPYIEWETGIPIRAVGSVEDVPHGWWFVADTAPLPAGCEPGTWPVLCVKPLPA